MQSRSFRNHVLNTQPSYYGLFTEYGNKFREFMIGDADTKTRSQRCGSPVRYPEMSIEVVEERCDTFKSGLALSFYFYFEFYFRLADTSEVLDIVQFRSETYA